MECITLFWPLSVIIAWRPHYWQPFSLVTVTSSSDGCRVKLVFELRDMTCTVYPAPTSQPQLQKISVGHFRRRESFLVCRRRRPCNELMVLPVTSSSWHFQSSTATLRLVFVHSRPLQKLHAAPTKQEASARTRCHTHARFECSLTIALNDFCKVKLDVQLYTCWCDWMFLLSSVEKSPLWCQFIPQINCTRGMSCCRRPLPGEEVSTEHPGNHRKLLKASHCLILIQVQLSQSPLLPLPLLKCRLCNTTVTFRDAFRELDIVSLGDGHSHL